MATDTHINYGQYRTLLATRLGDAGKVHYVDAELKRYALETLRTWNSLAAYSRERGTFNSVANQVWYDIPTLLDNGGVKLRKFNLKDQDLFIDIKAALMEDSQNLTANAWNGTAQFDLVTVQNAIEKARNEYLLRTSSIITNSTALVTAPPAGRVGLPDTVIDLIRVAFKPTLVDGKYRALQRADELVANYFNTNWNLDAATPLQYSKLLTPRTAIQLIPVPSVNGTLDILAVETGANLDIVNGVVLGVPDDMAWIVKFGALYYLLAEDGEGQDLTRASYCKQRFEQGIELATMSTVIQQAYVNDVTTMPISPIELDDWEIYWQSTAATVNAPTKRVVIAGTNLIGLAPVPIDGLTSVTLDVIRNHPVPVNDGEFIQVGREYLNVLLDYSVHLASFKEGEQQATIDAFDRFMQAASNNNYRLAAQGFDFAMYNQTDKRQNLSLPLKFTDADLNARNMGNYGAGT